MIEVRIKALYIYHIIAALLIFFTTIFLITHYLQMITVLLLFIVHLKNLGTCYHKNWRDKLAQILESY